MSKHLELLKKLGFAQAEIESLDKEDVNIDELSTSFRERQFELLKADAEYNNSIKDEAKKRGLAEAYTKAKKLLNTKFGLGLQNKDIDELDFEAISEKAQEKISSSGNEEVTKLTETIFELNKKLQAKEDEFATNERTLKETYENKINGIHTDINFRKLVSSKKRIIPEDEALIYLKSRLNADGVEVKLGEKGDLQFFKDGYPLKKADNTGFETLETLDERYLGSFTEKSNGSGGNATSQSKVDGENKITNKTLQSYLDAEMAN